jgi:hypothetical protein
MLTQYQVERYYKIPTVAIGVPVMMANGCTFTMDNWEGFVGTLPLLHGVTQDEDFDHFSTQPDRLLCHHAHPDWRFLSDHWFQHFLRTKGWSLMSRTTIMFPWPQYAPYIATTMVRMRCQRAYGEITQYEKCDHMKTLEARHACTALMRGKCPHRGTSIRAMVENEHGELVCPAHGLKFDKTTGKFIPRRLM